MNSFAHMTKAMDYEINRQIDLLQSGEKVVQEPAAITKRTIVRKACAARKTPTITAISGNRTL